MRPGSSPTGPRMASSQAFVSAPIPSPDVSHPPGAHLRLRTVYPGARRAKPEEESLAVSETITVLFTDLVGSTEINYAINPDAADELLRAHFSALRQAIAGSGGVEVKGLGDGVMVVFHSTSAALSCAVAMQQAVHRDNVGARHQLGLRIGLSGGECTVESDDYYGDPVIEAARLCAHADAGQILATDAVRVMAGRRSPYLFERRGTLELKGLPEPAEVLDVLWEPLDELAAERGVPLPTRLTHLPLAGVVARETEAALLTDAYKRVEAGSTRAVVLVSGDAGVGKTTLVAEAARRAAEHGACVLLGRCQEDVGASYAPFAEALHHYVAHAPEHVLRTHVEAHGGDIASMVPALGQRLGTIPAPTRTDPDTERYLLYGAVAGLLTAASALQPTVLVLDDLQWSDRQSLRLLRHVVTTVESARLLVLGTFRDSELSPSNPLCDLLGDLQREPDVSRIELKGFDDNGVLAFMEAAAGQRLEEAATDLAHALRLETEGNPFFVGELLRNLMETGAIYQDDRRPLDGGRGTVRGGVAQQRARSHFCPRRPARRTDSSGPVPWQRSSDGTSTSTYSTPSPTSARRRCSTSSTLRPAPHWCARILTYRGATASRTL